MPRIKDDQSYNVNRVPVSRRTKILAAVIICVVIIAAAVVTTVLLLDRKDYMTIRALPQSEQTFTVEDYSQSRLYLHKNGTFIFKVVCQGDLVFAGQGTYKKRGNFYDFTYLDMFYVVGDKITRSDDNVGRVVENEIRGKLVRLRDPENEKIFYFGK